MPDKHIILGVHITDRVHKAGAVQELLTEYGCQVKTRIGLHQVDANVCSPQGLILLELYGDEVRCFQLAERLAQITGVEVQRMVFDHPA